MIDRVGHEHLEDPFDSAQGRLLNAPCAVVDAGHSVADVAAFFQNTATTIRRWIRDRAETGSCHVRPRSGRPPLVGPAAEDALRAQVAAQPDATLAEHCAAWEASSHGAISVSTMDRTLERLGLTRKKRR